MYIFFMMMCLRNYIRCAAEKKKIRSYSARIIRNSLRKAGSGYFDLN